MIALVIIVGIFCYLLTIGIARTALNNYGKRHCKWAPSRCDSECFHTVASVFGAIVWPVVLPIIMGLGIPNVSLQGFAEHRRDREIREAEHKREVARINAEAVAIAERSVNIS